MKYISLNHNSGPTSFKKAVINGLAPDKGLYFPQDEVKLSKGFIESIKNIDDTEICYEIIKEFIGDEIPKNKLIEVINNTISFKIPLKKIEKSIYSLELFHFLIYLNQLHQSLLIQVQVLQYLSHHLLFEKNIND